MKNFKYLQPENLRQASEMLGNDWEESLPYGGGTDMYSLMKHGIVQPEKVVNLKSIPGMNKIEANGGGLKIGALVALSQIAAHPVVKEKYAVLEQAVMESASPQLRNMGTIGGNICQRPRCWYYRGDFDCLRKGGDLCYAVDGENKYHCIIGGSPCFIVYPSDPAVALTALDAKVAISDGKKARSVPISEFYILPEIDVERENILKPDEIVTGVEIPEPAAGTRSAYVKFKERDVWDFAVVSTAVVLQMNGRQVKNGRVAYGGVAPVPWLEEKVSGRLRGFTVSENNIEMLAAQALKEATPLEQNEYKLPLARNILKQMLRDLTRV
ncbi:MAG: xanthine dehydrogenase family protein subunit M [Calditrichia bacterium]